MDGEHYLLVFHCNKYRNERHQYFEIARDFQPLTINILDVLYGNGTLNYQLNIELFSAVHKEHYTFWQYMSTFPID